MRTLILLLVCLILAATPASRGASVNIAVDAGQLYNATGTPLAAGSLVLLLADTGNNGFSNINAGSLAVGDYLNGDDQILYRGEILIDGGLSVTSFGGTAVSLGEGLFPNLQTGDALSIVWFPNLTAASNSVAAGASYGRFTTLTPQNGSAGWSVPSAAANVDLNFYTEVKGGFYSESLGYANLVAIPEPSVYALAVIGLLGGLILLRLRARLT